jgi:hypothetical protein
VFETNEAHVAQVVQETAAEMRAKYEAGQQHHGGELWRKSGMLTHALEEVDDCSVYLRTLRQQIRPFACRLASQLDGVDTPVQRATLIEHELRTWLLDARE